MSGEDKRGPDGSSLKPVSSLLSHFEGLGQTKQVRSDAGVAKEPPRTPRFGENIEIQQSVAGRVSLDIPRRGANKSTPGTPRLDASSVRQLTPLPSVPRSSSPNRVAHKRPMSMNIQSSPQLTPSVIIESPRSPPKGPKGYFSSRNGTRSPDRLANTLPYGLVQGSASNPSSGTSTRPGTPRAGPIDNGSVEDPRELKRFSNLPGQSGSSAPKSSSVPPPVNRADKPKIPSKPAAQISASDLVALAPAPQRASSKDRVSPFSTPPSSDGSPSPERDGGPSRRHNTRGPPNSRRSPQPGMDTVLVQTSRTRKESQDTSRSKDSRQLGFKSPNESKDVRDPRALGLSVLKTPASITQDSGRDPAPEARKLPPLLASPDARELGFSGHKAISRQSLDEKEGPQPKANHVNVPYKAPATHRDPTGIGFSSRGSGFDDKEKDRPELPPRRIETEPSLKITAQSQSTTVGRARPPSGASISRSAKSLKANQAGTKIPSLDTSDRFPPPPKRNSVISVDLPIHTSPIDGLQISRATKHPKNVQSAQQAALTEPADDSDEAEDATEDTPSFRSEYPDALQANRRPPAIKAGHELATKFDARTFDVCGQYVCCTGFQTRVWDISTSENIMSLSHGETVKVLSVIFKPMMRLEDEGLFIWIGNNIGELHEVDIKTQGVMATNASHNRREILKLHRHKKNIWSIDEEGKLFVWPADESGSPNLKYSHGSHRVPRGHSFSMVIYDQLWFAAGKEIRVFAPGRDASFQVLDKPLTQPHTGDVTSGTWTSKQGGRAYFGHTDGKVTIYSLNGFSCIGNVKASDYMVKSMTVVGDWLWAAFKTGKIFVYDTSFTPWKVKKDWTAHGGPVAGLILDSRSIWTLNRLQVASLGHDNIVCFWDGMLEEDWLESEMQSLDVEYCDFREIRASVVTWNVGAATPAMVRNSDFLADAIHVEDPPELLVFGFQELVDLEDRALTAKSILGFGHKKKDNASSEHMSRVYREWRDHLKRCIDRYMGLKVQYTELHTSNLIGLFSCIFVRQNERGNIQNLSASEVKCGLKGHYGNKGALITRFKLDDSSLCFVNCHLAAGQTSTAHRNYDIASILEAESLPIERNPDVRASLFVGGGDGTQILDHEICVLNGDLNYRIDAMPRDTVVNFIKKNELGKLLERDQLMVSRRRVSGFRLSPFTEAAITFAPTYKYDVGTDNYDTSEKRRSPAWCDRLLYRGLGRIKQTEYRRHEVRVSDHRPVSGTFKMRVKTIDTEKQEGVRKQCQARFAEVKRRLASEASIDYLVNGLGLSEPEARKMISKH